MRGGLFEKEKEGETKVSERNGGKRGGGEEKKRTAWKRD